jgi:orotate phosphoribosyltransferase
VEDLVSTGQSSLQVIEVLRKQELEVTGMVSIFTYGFPVATEAFEKASLKYFSLTNYGSLIELALKKGIVSASQEKTLMEWRERPEEWRASR